MLSNLFDFFYYLIRSLESFVTFEIFEFRKCFFSYLCKTIFSSKSSENFWKLIEKKWIKTKFNDRSKLCDQKDNNCKFWFKGSRPLWTAPKNTMWAFKAEKGSEFIAAHRPGPSSQQQMAENNGLFNCWERVEDMHCGWYLKSRRSKLLSKRHEMSELWVAYTKIQV